jgi:hypothetical protein
VSEHIPAQERKLRKNYIAILSELAEERRAVAALPKSNRRVKDYVISLVTAVLNRRRRGDSYSID